MYICIEGIDGAGKTTQCKLLKDWFDKNGYRAELIREPTQSPIGRLIRRILNEPSLPTDDQQKILGLLFAADRLLLKDKIKKAKNEKTIIISDRCFYSSIAYQEPEDWIREINKFAIKPDIVIILDITPEDAQERFEGLERFEEKSFLERVRRKYLRIAEEKKFPVVDANRGINIIQEDIRRIIAPYLGICR
ncbi:MAG TPA: dTMP kinase [Methanothermobacter sp.]|jgi:dTMP kinase|uniref:Probable thymidylate kinase n=1 Tax=Methanothermobacter tenebrarum TaxID=680118 RepID=A0ABM7YEX2_9EURY|nr:dTMP kinase [Methanothermobacter tenebrarum]MDD3454520.1 dTMP kinase [Methanobacteriales archaeon]MDI6882476.1 dTMP kinase [Methanothermobacter sp.]MDX9693020.1 dTMP kinase [Methanothermobacter sp.]BDH79845.1 thymidylate kinase [Methanothermobacter tenebrarum]HHW16747.1 dTMP kinase [Methanothermobacter sp.]